MNEADYAERLQLLIPGDFEAPAKSELLASIIGEAYQPGLSRRRLVAL